MVKEELKWFVTVDNARENTIGQLFSYSLAPEEGGLPHSMTCGTLDRVPLQKAYAAS